MGRQLKLNIIIKNKKLINIFKCNIILFLNRLICALFAIYMLMSYLLAYVIIIFLIIIYYYQKYVLNDLKIDNNRTRMVVDLKKAYYQRNILEASSPYVGHVQL